MNPPLPADDMRQNSEIKQDLIDRKLHKEMVRDVQC